MKIKFVVGYRTQVGQSLYVTGSSRDLGSGKYELAKKMEPSSGELWACEIEDSESADITYHYFLKDESTGNIFHEFGGDRELEIPTNKTHLIVRDFWRSEGLPENALFTAPFTKAFFARDNRQNSNARKKFNLQLAIRAPRVSKDYSLGVIGSSSSLGAWDESKVVLMNDEGFPLWTSKLLLKKNETPFEYKYVIYSHKEERIVTWEEGDNRYFPLADLDAGNKSHFQTDENFRYPVGQWKTAGVAIPVFSLRSENGSGVGEFPDIKQLIDWSEITGFKVVQILPVNDTIATHTWVDSYPYAAISVQALNPIYANLDQMGSLKDKKLSKEIKQEASRLNALPEVDHEGVMSLKWRFFRALFKEQYETFLKSKAFKEFFKRNEIWLPDYAAFCCLRDKFGTPDFTSWGKYKSLSSNELKSFVSTKSEHYLDIALHYFIQFHLDRQLQEATCYARSKGVVLKGDIPIGIYRNSVDAWRLPELFNMGTQAGAPPDDFSISGQNWGFPTYNWDEMAKDGYMWWKERMVKMSEYFDVFRIDHILGFFRIWEIPWDGVEGLLGRFNPALPFSIDELGHRGITMNQSRFCEPYIRHHMIFDIFGNHAEVVFAEYLEDQGEGVYSLKPAFDTQRKVKEHFDQLNIEEPHNKDFNNWLKINLYRLHAEVLFMEAPDQPGYYNPRIGFHSSYSYAELDEYTKQRLNEIYTDYFYKRHNEFWRESAMQKLPMLKDATDMLICGEDLGMVPASVPGVMDDLQILSLAIQRMPNDDREFWNPADTPYMSVTSTGSHDMSSLREWWQEDPARSQRFFNSILGHHGQAPYFCEPWIAKDTIDQHLNSPSMLAIIPIQDLLAMDSSLRIGEPEKERINIPANPQHYWKFRLHLSMEELLGAEGFNGFLRQMIDQGGRSSDY
ncbi:MAG: 4-alpha-glucanotransferase [Cyclobacteriaceae bacterium]